MAELFNNNAESTLAAAISSTALTLTVASGDGSKFPNPSGGDFFRFTLFNKTTGAIEICKCTARSGDVFSTITRGEESTTPAAFNAGDVVANRPTAGFFGSLTVTDAAIQQDSYNYGSDTGAVNAYGVTLSPVPGSYYTGLRVRLTPANTNTSVSCTLAIASVAGGAKTIKRVGGDPLRVGDIKSGTPAEFVFDGTYFQLQNPASDGASAAYTFDKAVTFDDTVDLQKTVTFGSEYDNGTSGTTLTVNWGLANKQKVTLGASIGAGNLAFTDPAGVTNLTLKLTQDATGGRTVSWPSNVKWAYGVAPSLSTGAGAVDIINLYFDGTNYYGAAGIGFA